MNFKITTASFLFICFVAIIIAVLTYSYEYSKLVSQPHTVPALTPAVCPSPQIIYKDKKCKKPKEKFCNIGYIDTQIILHDRDRISDMKHDKANDEEDTRTFNYYGKSQR